MTSAVGPKEGLKSLETIKGELKDGAESDLYEKLLDVHIYPERSKYIYHTREYLNREFDFKLKNLVLSFDDRNARRDFFAANGDIKGIGFLQASHFLRNIGFTGYAILDKNILRSLYDFEVIDNMKPATSRRRYIEIEERMGRFAYTLDITIDELDLLLWSEKTGHIPR